MSWQRRLNDALVTLVRWERRIDPYIRPALDWLFRAPLQWLIQAQLNLRRRPEGLGVAEERLLPGEQQATAAIVESMSSFLRQHYPTGHVERAGNTKTYGVVRAELHVHADIPVALRRGIFAQPAVLPAWIRFAGPGPLAPADLDDNGILSIGVKVMGVPGAKLLDDEAETQDFTGLTAPSFTTSDVVVNSELQRRVLEGTPLMYFLRPGRSHLTELAMQALYARTHTSPLDTTYWSCAAYLLGTGQAMQYRFVPQPHRHSKVPWRPSPDYLREALSATLRSEDFFIDMLIQVQTDAFRMPVENGLVVWPDRLSPPVRVATLRLPAQRFDSPEQLAFADRLSVNPWHCVPEHRPLGNLNRARREIYLHLSHLRQQMNDVPHVEPTGEETFAP
ncbi:MAG TPA: hypothetical protein VFD59_16065 [Nocardioidaceae bacterium]|nr:hypothetical protein [Nocardioidaceae bacterium]